MPRLEIKEYKAKTLVPFLILPLVVVFYELVFGFMTSGRGYFPNIIHGIVAGCFYGLCLTVPLLFLRGKSQHITMAVLSLASSVPFLVEYFIYKQFKTFYDINTVTNGGEGALTGFGGTIVSLILTPSGLLAMVLFLLPTVLILVRGFKTKFKTDESDAYIMVGVVLAAVTMFATNFVIIHVNKADLVAYKQEYSFQNAVQRFGLLETIRLDCGKMSAISNGDLGFTDLGGQVPVITSTPTPTPLPTATPAPTIPGATPTPTPSPTPVPVPEVLDIDFTELAENSTGTTATLSTYCSTLEPSMTNNYTGLFAGKNLIIITAEAFTAEVIDPVLTPTLYRMATQGINFNDHYVQATAGTTGGEFSHLFGLLPMDGGSSVPHMTSRGNAVFNMGAMLNELGYYGMAFHNNDYTFYSRNTTHNLLGYSEGYMGWGSGLEEYVDPVWPESDLQMFEATIPMYIDQQPFNIYYMTVSGHSNYSQYANAMSKEHWEETECLADVYSSTVRAYIACNLELEASMTYLINALEEAGIADDTVIVINADHYPYGLDHDAPPGSMPYLSELYGYDVTNYMQRDHNRLIIWSGCLEDMDPIIVDTPTSSIDILPTLLNLFGLEWDSRLFPGRDVFSDAMPLVFNLNYDWKTELGTYISSKGEFIPNDPSIEVSDEYIEYVRNLVSNKITFCQGVLTTGYYGYVYEYLYPSEDAEG